MERKDDIVLKLSSTLKQFIDFFTGDLQKKVLELDDNAKSAKYYNQLKRVSNSLEQYLKKDVNLFYIGFLGSYSSGKSSTINSLLELWSTSKERHVSNNPTDDCITLLTNSKNTNSVFTFSKEGAVSIRTNTNFDIEILNDLVIMDTPGSGDPNIVESIVRDSLPLCDLIIYTLNATAPFTDIDKPFLEAQQSKLKDIPLLFVITRGDEFKKTKSSVLDDSNFDTDKFNSELQILISRINETIHISNFKNSDFILIDNLEKYNIRTLKEKIISYTIGNDSLIMLHNHKLSYFENEINEIYEFYHKLSKLKIEKCDQFIEKAHSNIEYFDRQTEVGKNKLKNIWSEYESKFMSIYNGMVKGYFETTLLQDLNEIKKFTQTDEYLIFEKEIKDELQKEADIKSYTITKDFENSIHSYCLQLKQDIMDMIDYDTYNISLDKTNAPLDITIDLSYPINPLRIHEKYRKKFSAYYQSKKNAIIKLCGLLSKNLKAGAPIDKIEENIISYRSGIFEVLEMYYEAVKMYNIAAFSYEVKSYISELGLSKLFDRIETADVNRAKYNIQTENILLEKVKKSIESYKEKTLPLSNTAEDLSTLAKDLKEYTQDNFPFEYQIDNYKDFNNHDILGFTTNVYQKLTSKTQQQLSLLKKDIRELNHKRIKKYISVIVIFLLIGGGVYISGFYLNTKTMPNDIMSTITSGVFASIIATAIMGYFDKFKLKKQETLNDFKNKLSNDNNQIVDELFIELKKENSDKQNEITENLYTKWIADFNDLINYTVELNEFSLEKDLLSVANSFRELLNNYEKNYKALHIELIEHFTNTDENTLLIEKIASQIKNESIKPSFELLTKTLAEIESVKKEIEILRR